MNRELTILVITLIILAGAAGAYGWLYQELANIKVASATLRADIQAAEVAKVRALEAKTESAGLANDEASVFAHVIETDGIVTFLQYLERSGNAFGATVEVASVSDTASSGTITISLSVEGTFPAVMKTLGILEHGSYAMSAKTVTLDSFEDGTWEMTGTFIALTKTP